MNAIAKALVFAVQYIESHGSDHSEDDDVQALEDTAFILQDTSAAEKAAFAKAATALGVPECPNSWASTETTSVPN
jgi:hypothetical protein